MNTVRAPRLPLAVLALATIVVITAGWWALALWPIGADTADWVARTRLVCFGASPSGLPDAGGWLLLIGEPIGMLAVLWMVWGDELRSEFARIHRHEIGRGMTAVAVLACTAGVYVAVTRVVRATTSTSAPAFAAATPLPARTYTMAPNLRLRDQRGMETSLRALRGQWVMVTFAFGQCTDMCPVIVHNALAARRDEGATSVSLLVVTLDPWRDTPDRLPGIATAWALGATDRVLSGTIDSVNATLDAWHVARTRNPDTGDILHGGIIAVVDPQGRLAWRIDGAPAPLREALRQVAETQTAQPSTSVP